MFAFTPRFLALPAIALAVIFALPAAGTGDARKPVVAKATTVPVLMAECAATAHAPACLPKAETGASLVR